MSDLPEGRLILCIDFDGVIHSYVSGWQGAIDIPDPPVEGAIHWLKLLIRNQRFELNIYSSRSRYEYARDAMAQWLLDNGLTPAELDEIKFPIEKPPAFLTIDDRAICFTGVFPSIEELKAFKPWYKKG